ncbi:hypothetical protein K458DRAFT_423659 [Lentithecium fluviatile CBS 122367]|uniref:Uncharacterized protein n=1 Tax=Lentithecium fluviatile CBS 122367 TaxID=1168545 RepID=A0A6G1IHU5_9PLEO|nr:hypothetical protein K458DRAFT_423659 [Lentithecium fluviatile CBS 122367]
MRPMQSRRAVDRKHAVRANGCVAVDGATWDIRIQPGSGRDTQKTDMNTGRTNVPRETDSTSLPDNRMFVICTGTAAGLSVREPQHVQRNC